MRDWTSDQWSALSSSESFSHIPCNLQPHVCNSNPTALAAKVVPAELTLQEKKERVRDKVDTGIKLTSSTVSGMHILYSFNNIFPLCASLLCIHNVSKQPSQRSPPPPDGMCVISGDVSAHVTGWSAWVTRCSPSYGWVRSSEPAGPRSGADCERRNELGSSVSPSYLADASSQEHTTPTQTGSHYFFLLNKSRKFVALRSNFANHSDFNNTQKYACPLYLPVSMFAIAATSLRTWHFQVRLMWDHQNTSNQEGFSSHFNLWHLSCYFCIKWMSLSEDSGTKLKHFHLKQMSSQVCFV